MKKILQRVISFVLVGCLSVGPFSGMSLLHEDVKAYNATYPKETSNSFKINGTDNDAKKAVTGSITKSAKWDDIEQGTATITIKEEDVGYSSSSSNFVDNTDYIIVMDASHSMDFIMSGLSSFCIYPKHYYIVNGQKVKLFSTSTTTAEMIYINDDQTPKVNLGVNMIDFSINEANYFYALMFNNESVLANTTKPSSSYKKFTGYIYSTEPLPAKETDEAVDAVAGSWKYKYYKDAYITSDVLKKLKKQDSEKIDGSDGSFWWYKSRTGYHAYNDITSTMKKRLKNAPKYTTYKKHWEKAWEDGGRAHLIYIIEESSATTFLEFNLDNTGHYDSANREIAYSSINEDSKDRWAYNNKHCINKLDATKNIIIDLMAKIKEKRPNASFAFVPFGYMPVPSIDKVSVTDTDSVDWFVLSTQKAYKNAKTRIQNCPSQGATTYYEWYTKVESLLKQHKKTHKGKREVQIFLLSDGAPTDNIGEEDKFSPFGGTNIKKPLKDEKSHAIIVDNIEKLSQTYGASFWTFGIGIPDYNELGDEISTAVDSSDELGECAKLLQDIARQTGAEYMAVPNYDPVSNSVVSTTTIKGSLMEFIESYSVAAKNKVLTDVVDSKFEIVKVTTKQGEASYKGQTVTWNIPTNAEVEKAEKNTLKIEVKLKDKYRFADATAPIDTYYNTNDGNCTMNFTVKGVSKKVSTKTPYLKYGAIYASASKTWQNVRDTSTPDVTVKLFQTMPKQTKKNIITDKLTSANKYKAGWNRCTKTGKGTVPLIK